MASDTNPSIVNIAMAGWRDGLKAIAAMMPVVAPAFLFALIIQAGYQMFPVRAGAFTTALALLVVFIAQSFALTPLIIAVHRYVLLDEVSRQYSLNPADPRFQRFFGLTVTIRALWIIPGLIMTAAPVAVFVVLAATLIAIAIVAIVTLRTIILFPAVAIDAPGVGWRNAMDDSKGQTWRLFFAFLLASLPLMPLEAAAKWILGDWRFGLLPGSPLALQALGAVLMAAMLVLTAVVFAATASWLYMAIGRRLNGPAPT